MSHTYPELITRSARVALIGFILSGPVGFLLVSLLRPQPTWISPAVFAEHYSPIQNVPYYFGLLLIGGMLMLAAAHYLNAKDEPPLVRFQLLLALGITLVFATLITFNYICQTTLLHNLALHYAPEHDPVISAFSMSNPLSFCWANEMWGYGILGVATWLMSGYYRNRHRMISVLLRLNCLLSLLGVVFTVLNIYWVLTPMGFVAYFGWNVLMIVLMFMMARQSKEVYA